MQDLRMAIAVGQHLVAEGFAGVDCWVDVQVARARANPAVRAACRTVHMGWV